MRVIGAGLPRTATTTQMIALEQLGFAPCYHMKDLMMDLATGMPLWEAVTEGNPDWQAIFGDAQSTVDWPAGRFYKQLMDEYPDAKVLLSVRSAEGWVASMRKTVWGVFFADSLMRHLSDARMLLDPLWKRYIEMMAKINWSEELGSIVPREETFTDEGLAKAMHRWNDEVKSVVPSDRFLAWDPKEGWEPLCEFLEVEVPDSPVPRTNDTEAFIDGITGGALAVINEWWTQHERPAESLHGAAAD